MTISSHQVHSVLRTYGKQLRRGLKLNRVKSEESQTAEDAVRISPEAKRLQVIERVAAQILLRMAQAGGTRGDVEQEVLDRLSQEFGQPLDADYDRETGRFNFYVVEPESGEALKEIQGEEAEGLNRRLAEITTQVVDETMIKG